MAENLEIKPAIRQMEVNETMTFPIESINNVRVYCSDLGATLKRLYKTRKSLDGTLVEVIRLS